MLDDLHNAGLATVQLLHYLARRLAGSRLLVLATIRAEEGEAALEALAEVTERIDLGPLPAAAVSRLAADAGQHELAETIMRRTRGHTLFVVETLRALAAGDRGAPESLQQVVLARLRRVGPATEELLRAGAVLGATVDPATAAAMIGVAPHLAAQRCEVAAAARLLVLVGRSYEFANDLVQEVTLRDHTAADPGGAPPAGGRAARRRRRSSSPPTPDAAGDWSGAVAALLLAAEQATRRFAVADAEVLAGRALDAATHIGEPEPLARAYLARARARVVLTRFQPAFDDLRAALDAARRAGHRSLEMTVLRELGGHAGVAVSMVEASAFLQDGLRIAEGLDDRAMQARILSWLAVQASNRLRFGDSLGYARRAVAAARGTDDEAALAAGLDGLKNAHAYLGELGPLREVLAELLPLLGRLGDPDLQQWAMFESAFPAVGAADWAAAEERIGAAITISRAQRLHAARVLVHRAPGLGGQATGAGRPGAGLWPAGRWRWPPAPSIAGTPPPELRCWPARCSSSAGPRRRCGC